MNSRVALAVLIAALIAGVVGAWLAGQMAEEPAPSDPDPQNKPTEVEDAALEHGKQKRIWDAEAVTFQIEHRFGKAVLDAILKTNQKQLAALVRDDFTGAVPVEKASSVRGSGLVSETRWNEATESVDAVGFVSALLSPADHFQKIERERLRVLSIERDGETDRWTTRLLITLAGTGKSGGPALFECEQDVALRFSDEKKVAEGAVIESWKTTSSRLRSAKRHLMEEMTAKAGLDKLPVPDNWKLKSGHEQYRFQTAVADFDRDGFLDIAIAALGRKPLLLRSSDGETFADVAAEWDVVSPAPAGLVTNFVAAWIDFDNDSFPDLLLGDRLYRNINGKRFEDITDRSGLYFDPECMGCVVADYDGDGLLDLYILYQRPFGQQKTKEQSRWVGETNTGKENQLWKNEGNGRFRDVTSESNAGGGKRHTHAAAWFFFDNDHHPDLYIANDFGGNVILRNRGNGRFEDVSETEGAGDFATSMGVTTGDVNNDGNTDIYVANMYSKMGRRIIGQVCNEDYPEGIFPQIQGSCAGNRLYLKNSSGGFREIAEQVEVNAVGWAYAPAMVDLDGDGWLDLYAATGFMSFQRGKPDG